MVVRGLLLNAETAFNNLMKSVPHSNIPSINQDDTKK